MIQDNEAKKTKQTVEKTHAIKTREMTNQEEKSIRRCHREQRHTMCSTTKIDNPMGNTKAYMFNSVSSQGST